MLPALPGAGPETMNTARPYRHRSVCMDFRARGLRPRPGMTVFSTLLLAAVTLDGAAIELDAEAGPLRQSDHAVGLDMDRFLQQLVAQTVGVLVEFEHQPVRDRGDEMKRRGECHRAGKGVRRDHQVMRLRQSGDTAAFGEPAGPRDVRLHDVDGAAG